jgi:hypothetical protein
MLVSRRLEEIRVYEGVAERTGVLVDRNDVRHSDHCCTSLSAMIRKARAFGDGIFYLKLNAWPADTERVELRKQWVVIGDSGVRTED